MGKGRVHKAWIYNSFDLSEGGQEASDGLLDGWLAGQESNTNKHVDVSKIGGL